MGCEKQMYLYGCDDWGVVFGVTFGVTIFGRDFLGAVLDLTFGVSFWVWKIGRQSGGSFGCDNWGILLGVTTWVPFWVWTFGCHLECDNRVWLLGCRFGLENWDVVLVVNIWAVVLVGRWGADFGIHSREKNDGTQADTISTFFLNPLWPIEKRGVSIANQWWSHLSTNLEILSKGTGRKSLFKTLAAHTLKFQMILCSYNLIWKASAVFDVIIKQTKKGFDDIANDFEG